MKKPDSIIISALLSISGGLQDAYTFNVRGRVFANAQTGNIVLMSQNLLLGNIGQAVYYCLPVLSYLSGVVSAVIIQNLFHNSSKVFWRQVVLLMEIVALTAVGFFPEPYHMVPNMLVSFSCAMQVHSFKEIRGNRFASTMCIGNITSASESLGKYIFTRNRRDLSKFLIIFGMVCFFAAGAGIGGVFSYIIKEKTIWISSVLLIVSALLMNKKR